MKHTNRSRARRALAVLAGACALASAPGAVEAKWLKAETERFIVYSDGREAPLRDYVTRLEDFDKVLRAEHGVGTAEAPRKLEIFLVDDGADLRRVAPELSSSVLGFYSADEAEIFAVAIRSESKQWKDDVLFHEYAHHFMKQYFPAKYPAWIVEGWAEYYMTTDVRADGITLGGFNEPRATGLFHVTWMPMKDLLRGEREKGDFYGQSWALVHYMNADEARRRQLADYLRRVSAGEDPATAMEAATGRDLKDLQRDLQRYVRGRLTQRTFLRKHQVDWGVTVSELPPSADDLLLDVQRLKNGVAKEDAAEVVARIRARAAKHPGDAFAELALARAEVLYGDRAAGEAVLERRLAADPNEVEALRLMAASRMRAGDEDEARRAEWYAQARPFIAKAFKADPNHYQTLYAYARSRSTDPDYPSENTLNTLLLANELAPQVDSIAFETASGLARRGRTDEAIAMFERLANAPHGGDMSKAAKAQLEKLRGGGEQKTAQAAPAEGGKADGGAQKLRL